MRVEWYDIDSVGDPGLPKLAPNKKIRCPEIYCIYTVRQLKLFTYFLLSLVCLCVCVWHTPTLGRVNSEQFGGWWATNSLVR